MSPSTNDLYIDELPLTSEETIKLIDEFNSSISQFTDTVCEICDKLIYRSLAKQLSVTEIIRAKFLEVSKEFNLNPTVKCCSRCYSNLKKPVPKIPAVAKCNNLDLYEIPPQLTDLNQVEIGLIKQVRAYMKIYLLCRGRGQKAIRGLTVHFPLQVQEVINCLPNIVAQQDVVVVHQILGEINEPKDISIRPKKVLDALKWLKVNNNLYKNININLDFQFVNLKTVNIAQNDEVDFETDLSLNVPVSYISIGEGQDILRCTINQANSIFNQNAGKLVHSNGCKFPCSLLC